MASVGTDSCGTLLAGYGKFNASQALTLWETVTAVPHYWINVRVSILYIDFWSSSSMKLYIDTKLVATSTYSGASNITDQCSVEPGRNTSDKYQKIGYNAAHNDTNFKVTLNGSGTCRNRGGGGGGSNRCGPGSSGTCGTTCCCNWMVI